MYTFEDKLVIDKNVTDKLHRQNERKGLTKTHKAINSIDEALELVEQARNVLLSQRDSDNNTYREDYSNTNILTIPTRKNRMF